MRHDIPRSVRSQFIDAGWFPTRRVDLPASLVRSVPQHHPAIGVLTAFSGLHVGSCGSGEQCATSDIEFEWLGSDLRCELPWWQNALGTQLVGIGMVHHRHSSLFVGTGGRCFGLSHVDDTFVFEGPTISVAVERLLLGRRSRPMFRTDQESVTLYGVEYRRQSPETYWPPRRA